MNKKKLIIIIAAVVVVLGGGAGAFLALRGPAEGEEPPQIVEEPAALVNLDTFMVNIYDPEGDRNARLKMELTVSPEDVAAQIAEDPLLMAKLRDRILTLLTSKTYEELRSPVGKETLRREVKARLDPLLEDGEVREVLFSDFVVQ